MYYISIYSHYVVNAIICLFGSKDFSEESTFFGPDVFLIFVVDFFFFFAFILLFFYLCVEAVLFF